MVHEIDIFYLKNQLLIAMPHLADPNFAHSITYLCEHNDKGAMGVVINRASNFTFGDILEQLNITSPYSEVSAQPVLMGGPVQTDRGFVLHRPIGDAAEPRWESSIAIGENVFLTTSRDIIEAIANKEGPDSYLVALGYAGWDGGQLEDEINANFWLNAPVEERILFDTPIENRWHAAAKMMGIDLNLVATEAGHA